MPFERKSGGWQNGAGGHTPLNAGGLNDLEDRIEAAVDTVEGGIAQLTINAAQSPYGMSTSGTATANATALQAAIAACNSAGGGEVFIPGGTYDCNPVTIPGDSIAIRGMGREATILVYAGSSTFLTNSATGTLRRNFRLSDLTIDTRTAGAGWKALVIDNMWESVVRNVFINGTSGAAGVGIELVGSASKSTYFNRFEGVHVVANTSCVDIGDQCNANTFIGGVLDGTGFAIRCNPTTTTTDTCKFFDVGIQTTGATVVQLGNSTATCTHFNFIGCRFEPAASTLALAANSSRHAFIGGTLTNVTVSNTGSENDFIVPSAGLFEIGHVGGTAKRTLDLRQTNAGITFGDDPEVCLYRRTADCLKTDGSLEAAAEVKSYQGGAQALRMTDAQIYAAGTNTDQNFFLDAKGTGAVQINTQNGATGGLRIGASGAQIKKHLSGTATWDPGSVAAGAQTTTTVTVTGAAVGDTVAVGFGQDLQGMQLTGYVSATNTVTVVLRNGTAGSLDLASGTLRADVWQH